MADFITVQLANEEVDRLRVENKDLRDEIYALNVRIKMKIKCSDLVGAQLDYAVAKCSGPTMMAFFTRNEYEYTPSTDWEQGGPIIEREKINMFYLPEQSLWWATNKDPVEKESIGDGPTALIAAMRCYCCAKLGEEVEIPEGLK